MDKDEKFRIALVEDDEENPGCQFLKRIHEPTQSPYWGFWEDAMLLTKEDALHHKSWIESKYPFWKSNIVDKKPNRLNNPRNVYLDMWKRGEITKEEMITKMRELSKK